MEDAISERVLDQRLHNRAREALEVLADVEAAVLAEGSAEFLESFFDFPAIAPLEGTPRRRISTMTDEEWEAWLAILAVMQRAYVETPSDIYDPADLPRGWRDELRPLVARALPIFQKRGRFAEQVEEMEPSFR